MSILHNLGLSIISFTVSLIVLIFLGSSYALAWEIKNPDGIKRLRRFIFACSLLFSIGVFLTIL